MFGTNTVYIVPLGTVFFTHSGKYLHFLLKGNVYIFCQMKIFYARECCPACQLFRSPPASQLALFVLPTIEVTGKLAPHA